MPSGPRIRTDNVFGTTTDNPLTAAATTMNSAGLANLAAVSSAHAVIVLDPLRAAGAPEIVVVTAHTGSATSATITRGAYGTSAREHAAGTLWVHAPTRADFVQILTASTRPSSNDRFEGMPIWETDTDRLMLFDGAAWQPAYNPPRAGASRTTNLSIGNNAWERVTFTTEDVDTDGMYADGGSEDRFTCVTPGRYLVVFTVAFASNTTGLRGYALAKGVTVGAGFFAETLQSVATSGGHACTIAGEVVLAAAETVSCQVFQNSGGALNITPSASSEPCRATIRWVAPT
ncbi:MAG TPA: hypothetical protein VJS45_07685 [Acidimicrobiia bacterium]|nr:hypothetical protein [Acidimicrobiia bacterium]